jgi:hypothetical protein
MPDYPKVADAVKKANGALLLAVPVERIDVKKGKQPRILAICDSFIALYTESKPTEKCYLWNSTTSYSFESQNIEMKFGKDSFKFTAEDIEGLNITILSLLEGCMTLIELGPLQLSRIRHQMWPTGGISLLGRFKALVHKGKKVPQEPIRAVERLIAGRGLKFDTTKLDDWESCATALYETLSLVPSLQTFKVATKQKKYDLFGELAKSVGGFQTLKLLEVEDISKKFKDFRNGLKKSAITGLSIKGDFKKEHFPLLKGVGLTALNLSKSFSERSGLFPKLLNDVLSPLSSSLQLLSLERLGAVRIEDIAKFLPNLTALSLKGNKISVGPTLAKLAPLSKLRMLCLARNDGTFGTVATSPPSLVRLDVSAVMWNIDQLRQFWDWACGCPWPGGLELDISTPRITDDDELRAFWSVLLSKDCRITSFVWDTSAVSEHFVAFLRKCPLLADLAIRSSLKHDDGVVIQQLADQFSRMRNLRSLIITGKETKAGRSFLPILTSLPNQLTFLDVSYQDAGDDAIIELGKYVRRNKSLRTLMFEAMGGTVWARFDALIQAAEDSPQPFDFLYPVASMDTYVRDGQLDAKEVPAVKRRFLAIQDGTAPSEHEIVFDVKSAYPVGADFPRFCSPDYERVMAIDFGDRAGESSVAARDEDKDKDQRKDGQRDTKANGGRSDGFLGTLAEKPKPSKEEPLAQAKKKRRESTELDGNSSGTESNDSRKKAAASSGSDTRQRRPEKKTRLSSGSGTPPGPPAQRRGSDKKQTESEKQSAASNGSDRPPPGPSRETATSDDSDKALPRRGKKIYASSDSDQPRPRPPNKAANGLFLLSGSDDADVKGPGSDAGDVPGKRSPGRRPSARKVFLSSSEGERPAKGSSESDHKRPAKPKKGKKPVSSEYDDEAQKQRRKRKRPNWNDFPIGMDEPLADRQLLKEMNEEYSLSNVLNVLKEKK